MMNVYSTTLAVWSRCNTHIHFSEHMICSGCLNLVHTIM